MSGRKDASPASRPEQDRLAHDAGIVPQSTAKSKPRLQEPAILIMENILLIQYDQHIFAS
jgi:hypothetical protein